jgi:outer membrane protein TolC
MRSFGSRILVAASVTLLLGCRTVPWSSDRPGDVDKLHLRAERVDHSTPSASTPIPIESQPQPVELAAAVEMEAVVQIAAEVPLSSEWEAAIEPSLPVATSVGPTIDLITALSLTTGENTQIAFANARIQEAYAQLDRARALKLPSIRAGANYNKHEGRIQDVAGQVIETSRGSFYSGLGANAVGAGSPIVPGLVSQFHLADAIFQPRIAQRTAAARQAGATATINDQLLLAATSYMELLRAAQEEAVARDILERCERLERTAAEYSRVGQGLESDYDRARTEVSLRRIEKARVREARMIASARLAEIIRWDAGTELQPAEDQVVPLRLLETDGSTQSYIATALSQRPELKEAKHLVCEAVERLNREKNAPLVPSLLLAASYGGLGGGLGGDLTNYGDRFDADAVAFWELRQLGAGDRASKREAAARLSQARVMHLQTMDRVAREVVEAIAHVQSRSEQLEYAAESVRLAESSFQKNWERIENNLGLPIEVLQAIQALSVAKREYVQVVVNYNIAQFRLQRALGWQATPEL